MTDQLRQALAGILTIVDESTGVAGYHLNGNLAEWDEFPEVSAARDALAQQPAAAVPDGWKLVPVEPTIDMEDAGRKAASGFMRLGEAGRVFRAMLAASPAAPAPAPAPAAQEPVAWLRDDGDGDLGFSASEDGFPVYAAPPAAEQSERGDYSCPRCGAAIDLPAPYSAQVLCRACGKSSAATAAQASAEQPDTVKVPRESVRRAVAALRSRMCTECGDEACCMPAMRNSARELRALLGKEGA